MYEQSINKLIGFSIFEWMYYSFFGTFTGFIAAYLLACGMDSTILSIVIAVFLGTSFVGSFFWGTLCDRIHSNKKVFIFELSASIVTAAVLYWTAGTNVLYAAFLYPLFGFLCTPLGTVLDSWMLKSFDRDYGMFGKARAVGSIGFATASLVIGVFIKKYGYIALFIGIIVFSLTTLIFAVLAHEKAYETNIQSVQEKAHPMQLLKYRSYMYMLAILFLTGLACAPVNNLKIVFLENVGGDVGILGFDAFIGVMIQAVFIFLASFLKQIKAYTRMLLVTVFVFLDLLLVLIATNYIVIIIGTIMWNISFGIMLPTIREITETSVAGSLKSTAHTMADAVYYDFSGIVALSYSGFLLDKFSEKSLAFLGMVVITVAMIVTAITRHSVDRIKTGQTAVEIDSTL